MSLYRYLPYWRHVREEFVATLDAMSEPMFAYRAHPALPRVGELIVELADAQMRLLDWLEDPSRISADPTPRARMTSEEQRALLEEAWERLDAFAAEVTREELTEQRQHPTEAGRFFSVYELLCELLHLEIHHMGQIELQLLAWQAEEDGAPIPETRARRMTRRIE